MVTFQELNDLRLGRLQSAVTDWQTMTDKLKKAADGGGDSAASLVKKAKAADWKGQNATVTKGFVTTTAREFDDAVTAARSVHTILNGAHAKLKQCKEDLRQAVDKAAKKNIYINDKGAAIASVPPPHVAGDAKIEEPTQAELDAAASEISSILKRATEADTTAATALRFHAQDKHDFRSHGFKSFEGAQNVIANSNEFVKLANMDPSTMSNEQLARLNELAKENGKNPIFAERIATGLGAKGTLNFWADAVDLEAWRNPRNTSPEDREARTEILGALEKNLGVTLGTATQSGSEAMATWKDKIIGLGGQEVASYGGSGGPTRAYGFQAMSNLMRHGTYETEFLDDYGDALVAYEKEHTGDVEIPGPRAGTRENVLPWDAMPSYSKYPMHFGAEGDAGTDPMTGYMQALSHNPDAATNFFDSNDPQDNAQYVLKDRPTFDDVNSTMLEYGESADDYDGPNASIEATGDALVAGATGMTPGDTEAPDVPHTAGQQQVMENAVNHLGARGDDFPSELRDDMAKVMTNHGATVHDAMSSVDGSPPLDQENLMSVTREISRDPETYSLLSQGMNHAIVADIHGENAHPEDSLDRAGYTVGFMEEARHQAIGDQTAEELRDAGWNERNLRTGVQTAAGFVPGVGGPISNGAYLLGSEWLENEQGRIKDGATEDYQSTYEARQQYLDRLAEEWYGANGNWADGQSGYSADRGIYSQIEASANDGNDKFDGLSGDQ